MTLVDTSVWIHHFHSPESKLISLIERKEILTHVAVLGEIASGHIKNRSQILGNMKLIPRVAEVNANEILEFIESRCLFGKGLGWVDIQLMASCFVTGCNLFTYDRVLKKTYEELVS